MAFPTAVNSQITDTATTPSHFTTTKLIEVMINLSYSNLITNTNIGQQNAVSNQQAVNELGISIVGAAVNVVSSNNQMAKDQG